jgi:hypothetical protein
MEDEKKDEGLKKISSIHTLESDLASAVMDNNYGKNIIKIITNPKKFLSKDVKTSGESIGENKNNIFTKKNIIIFLIFIVLISSISVILYILYKAENFKNVEKTEDTATTTISTLPENNIISDQPVVRYNDVLRPEIIQSSDFTKLDRNEIVLEINKIKNVLLEKNIGSNNNVGISSNLDMRQFFEKIRYSGDDSLLRSFSDTYAFGLYINEKKQFENYLLIEVGDFDLAFRSILNWEKFIPVDLKDIFIGNNEIVINSTSTNISSSSVVEKKYYKKDTNIFVDRVFKNHDIREYVNNSNNITIIYGFINNKFLLITSGESSFLDIKNRLLKENIAR